ncbi:hypothetical protein OI910_21515 [Pseudomonas aeruginosa]|nr:hypothetical protein OI910_21515 [Pseudomonas aeruginosa]
MVKKNYAAVRRSMNAAFLALSSFLTGAKSQSKRCSHFAIRALALQTLVSAAGKQLP